MEIFLDIIITAAAYMIIPLAYLAVNKGRFDEKRAQKIALWNSIIIGAAFMLLTIEMFDGNVVWKAGPAVLYYWINRAILTNKNNHKNENTSTYKTTVVSHPNTNRPPQISDPNDPPQQWGTPLSDLALDKSASADATDIATTAKTEQNMNIIYCRKCGIELMSDSAFCYKCGEKVVVPHTKEETPTEVSAKTITVQNQNEKLKTCEQETEAKIRKKKISKIAIIVGCVVIAVLCVLLPLIKSVNESYAWKVTVLGWNSDEYSTTYQSSISKHNAVYCHIKVTGGAPGDTTRIRVSGTLPDGETINFSFDDLSYDGWTGCFYWADGINIDPEYGDSGIIRVFFYDDEGNMIGRSSVIITK